jgi:hypothetical protein
MYKILLLIAFTLTFSFSAVAENVVEVMGNITANRVYVRQKPDVKSKAVARLNKNAKVLIQGRENDEWIKISLFNRQMGYILAKYVDLRYENVTRKESQAKALIDINNLLDQFNDTVAASWFAEKQKIIPSLKFLAGKHPNDIYLLYTAVDSKGKSVPSLKENPLQKEMIKLLELVYMKMIVLPKDRYRITIKVPDFIGGTYKGRTDNYAVLTLEKDFANINEIKNDQGSVWDYIRSAKKPEEIFSEYPH